MNASYLSSLNSSFLVLTGYLADWLWHGWALQIEGDALSDTHHYTGSGCWELCRNNIKVSDTVRLKSIEPSHLHCLTLGVQTIIQHDLKPQ